MLIGIGLWASRKVHNQADFLLGGRQLGPWVAGLSYAASTSSAWVLLGFTGFVFAFGTAALWILPGIIGGHIVMWVWFGPRIRRESSDRAWLTPTEFISAHTSTSEQARIAAIAAALISFCFIFYIAAQFDAAATAFSTNFELDATNALLISAGIILFYCLLGGFWAASITDMVQGIVMLLAALLLPILAVIEVGGMSALFENLHQLSSQGQSGLTDWTGGNSGLLLVGFIFGVMGTGLGTLGQPHLLSRLMAVKGEQERRQSFLIVLVWTVLVYTGMTLLALATRALEISPDNNEQIFYLLAQILLPPVLAGVVIAAILSAVMSTVDSLLLAAAAAISHDLGIAQRLRINEVWTSRVIMTVIVIAASILALSLPDTIFNRVLFAWSGLGAAFGPIIAARVLGHEPRANTRIVSILAGFSFTALFYSFGTIDPADTNNAMTTFISQAAHLPGDPFERVVPFVMASLIIVIAARIRSDNLIRPTN